MERFLNDIAGSWKNVICVGTGNEESSGEHIGSAALLIEWGIVRGKAPYLYGEPGKCRGMTSGRMHSRGTGYCVWRRGCLEIFKT